MTISSSSHEPRSLSPSPLPPLPLPLMPPLRPPALLLHFLPGAADRVVVARQTWRAWWAWWACSGRGGWSAWRRCPRARRQLLPQWPLPHRHCSSSRAAAASASAAAAAAAVAAAAAAVLAAAEAAAEAAPRLRTYITAAPTAIGANTPDAAWRRRPVDHGCSAGLRSCPRLWAQTRQQWQINGKAVNSRGKPYVVRTWHPHPSPPGPRGRDGGSHATVRRRGRVIAKLRQKAAEEEETATERLPAELLSYVRS